MWPEAVTTVIARELDRVAVQAKAEIEDQLSQAKNEALELATAGEALEVEIETLKVSIAAIATERDAMSAIAAERHKEIINLTGIVKREQKDAESVRVDLGKMQLKVDLSLNEHS
jgi:predicted  nucleic acid-binding Zn-ribbon protein